MPFRPAVLVAGLFLLFAVAFNLVRLYPEVAIDAPLLNDGVLHHLAFERAAAALAAGQDPSDPWLAPVVLGYPLFHHYQHLAWLFPAACILPLAGLLDTVDIPNRACHVRLCLRPLPVHSRCALFLPPLTGVV